MARISPAMADGRCLTNYLPACDRECILMSRFGITDAFTWRQFIQANPDKILKETRRVNVCTTFDKCDGSECHCVLCQSCRNPAPDTTVWDEFGALSPS